MTNEQRTEKILKRYGFDFNKISKTDIRKLLEDEILNYQNGSSEYIRVLCGYLYCIGDSTDVDLIKKAKYSIDFDVQCMIDQEWIDSLENNFKDKKRIVESFIYYYQNFEATDLEDNNEMFSEPF